MNAGAWFLVACAVAALICVAAGAIAVLRAAATLKRHATAIVPDELIVKARAAKEAAERLQTALPLADTLLPRAIAALERIEASVRVLRFVFSLKA